MKRELLKRLTETREQQNNAILSGVLPDYASYCLATGQSRGVTMAIEILEDVYNNQEKFNNDK
jgi:hypothetical protein